MAYWVLRPIRDGEYDPWEPWYDKAFGFVVKADTEHDARRIAQSNAGEEAGGGIKPWKNRSWSTCVPIEQYQDEDGLVMMDFASA